jgi:undecaprenyl-diphosphatase
MDITTLLHTILLGIVEGLTEFLPISSTGHLILVIDLLGFNSPPGKVFEIVIQLGAILAVCWLYREKLLNVIKTLPKEKKSQDFTRNLIIAFVPSVILGFLFYGFIKEVLFSPTVVSVSLIIGGLIIILIEKREIKVKHKTIEHMTPKLALYIGLCQTISMIPGTSRAGATIMGAMLLGVERKTATEFSFFLAIPTMMAATVYDIYKNYEYLSSDNITIILIGFITAFFSALFVIRWLIGFVSHHDFSVFGWYRIAVGSGMLFLLS